MRLGIALPQLGRWATPENVITVARRAEEVGYHSLWVLERLLWPLEPKTPYPATPDGHLPEAYQYVLDPIVTLAYAAANTQRIHIGTSVLVMPYHTPAVLAKQLATLDVMSGGRLNCGLGLGWSEDEYEATNASFKNRGEHFDEFLKCLNALWTKEEPEFQGKFYQISRSKVYPKPVQKPRPPLTIGGFGPRALKRAVTLADGYNGILMPFNQMSELLTGFKDAAEASGRSLFELQVVCRGNLNLLDHSPGSHRYPLVGTEREVKDDLKRYEEMGVTEIFFDLNFESGAILDKLFRTMEHLHPNL